MIFQNVGDDLPGFCPLDVTLCH